MSAASVEWLLAAWALLLGASVGSFLNVVIARLPAGLSIVHPRSRCPSCHAPIAWYDNVPILSWLLLRARCRGCGAPISARYPLVEALGGGLALLALWRHGFGGAAAAEFAFAALLLALAFIDLDTWLLPHALTWPLIFGGLALSALGLTAAGSLRDAFRGAGVGFAAFAAVSVLGRIVFKREALGFGDVWLLAGLGAWLGLKALLPVILLSSLQGSVVGLVLAAMGKLPKGEAAAGDEPPPYAEPSMEPPASTGATGPGASPLSPAPAGERGSEITGQFGGEGAEEPWTPPRNAVPFGPFLVAGALEWLYLGGWLARLVPTLEIFR